MISKKRTCASQIVRFVHDRFAVLILFFLLVAFTGRTFAQTEVAPWGNITGIRIDGQLINFETSLRLVANNWATVKATAMERQKPKFLRDSNKQIITTKIDSVGFTEIVEDTKAGSANVNVQVSSNSSMNANGVFFAVALPLGDYVTAITKANNGAKKMTSLVGLNEDLRFTLNAIRFVSSRRQLEFVFEQPTTVIIRKNLGTKDNNTHVYFTLLDGNVQAGATVEKKFSINASGYVDKRPVNFTLDTANPGKPFAGFGGNFRLQNPTADPQVIDYCLKNLRVAWGRVEFPWQLWQPAIDDNPTDSAKNGKLNPRVQQAMDMAVRLHKMRIPVILSGWFPPQWAVVGKLNMQPVNGIWGNQLDSTKMNKIYKSITDYILYLKNNYATEVALFSFNESDLGINVRQTAEEHDALIKGLGAYFKSKGLAKIGRAHV